MPGPIYTAGRTPLTSGLNGSVGGNLKGPSQPVPKKVPSRLTKKFIEASGSRVPPTLIAFGQTSTWQNNTTPKDVGTTITWQTGDIIIVVGVAESEATFVNTPTVTGLTFNAIGTANTAADSTWMHRWVAVAGSSGSGIVTVSRAGSTGSYGAAVWQYRGSDGLGSTPAIEVAVNVKTIDLTETLSNSAVITVLGDWGAGSVSSPTWTPSGQTQQIASDGGGATYSVLGADWADVGAATTTAYGLTAGLSTTQNITKVIIEILGTTGSGPEEVTGSAALSAESSLTSSGIVEVFGSATLSIQSSITTVSKVDTTASATLSVQSGLSVTGTRAVLGTSALTVQSNLSAIASTSITGSATLSIQSSMAAVGSNTVLGSTALSGQSGLAAAATNTVIAAMTSSIQSSLIVVGKALTGSSAALTAQSNVVVNSFATTFGVISLTSTVTMTSAGIVGTLPPTAVLSFDSVLSASALVTVRAISVLSAQSVLTVTALNTVRALAIMSTESILVASAKVTTNGVVTFSSQLNLAVTGNTTTTPPSATLSSHSNMTVTGSITVKAQAQLAIDCNIVSIGRSTTTGVVALSVQSSLTTIGTRVVLAASVLSVQSSLTAIGIIPAIVTGQAILTIQTNISIDANSTPPWIFPFIELSKQIVTDTTEFRTAITNREGG